MSAQSQVVSEKIISMPVKDHVCKVEIKISNKNSFKVKQTYETSIEVVKKIF